jgi:hypothetical protein
MAMTDSQRAETQAVSKGLGSELAHCHFVLLAKATHMVKPSIKGQEGDSICLRNHTNTKQHGYKKVLIIFLS